MTDETMFRIASSGMGKSTPEGSFMTAMTAASSSELGI
jgi:hypothetical protein